jgi:hypothetical protein
MAKTYTKTSDGFLQEVEQVTKTEDYSLETIQQKIQDLTAELNRWKALETEAAKLNIK